MLAGISSLMAVVVVFFSLLLCLLCECGDAGVSDSMLLVTNEQLYTPLPRGREGGSVVSMLPEDYPVETITGVPKYCLLLWCVLIRPFPSNLQLRSLVCALLHQLMI